MHAHSKKKGVGWVFRHAEAQSMKEVGQLHVHWFYTWGYQRPAIAPKQLHFVPMIWGYYPKNLHACIRQIVNYKKHHIVNAMLAFNEPDGRKQSDFAVSKAIKAWPQLEAAGLPLGSPACAKPLGKWMKTFMRGVQKHHYRVNFVCVHWYGAPNPRGFLKSLRRIHHMYHRPLWITEFAVADWSALKTHENKDSPAAIIHFMKVVLPALNRLRYVQRYAWFPGPQSTHTPVGRSALFNKNGSLTALGRIYAAD